jgi:hypothetical protein
VGITGQTKVDCINLFNCRQLELSQNCPRGKIRNADASQPCKNKAFKLVVGSQAPIIDVDYDRVRNTSAIGWFSGANGVGFAPEPLLNGVGSLTWHTFRLFRIQDDNSRIEVVSETHANQLTKANVGEYDHEFIPSSRGLMPAGKAKASLILGAVYQVEVNTFGLNGMVTTTVSEDIIADWTPPKCQNPGLNAANGLLVAGEYADPKYPDPTKPKLYGVSRGYPDGASRWWGVRQFAWLGGEVASIDILFNHRTCSDAQSGITAGLRVKSGCGRTPR